MDEKELDEKLARCGSKEEKVILLDQCGEDLFQKGKYADAIKYFSRALRLVEQPNARAYFAGQAGICYYNAKNDQRALSLLLKAAGLFDPDQPEFMPDMYGFVHFHLGSLFEYQGRHAKSLEARRICEQYIDSQEQDTRWMLYAGISRNYEGKAFSPDGQHLLPLYSKTVFAFSIISSSKVINSLPKSLAT